MPADVIDFAGMSDGLTLEVDGVNALDSDPERMYQGERRLKIPRGLRGGGAVTFRYDVLKLLNCTTISWCLTHRRRHVMRTTIERCTALVVSDDAAQEVKREFDTDVMSVPISDTMNNTRNKFDLVFGIYQAHLMTSMKSWRCYSLNASVQGGWGLLCGREDLYMWESTLSTTEVVDMNLSSKFASRHLPMSTIGYGNADAVAKSTRFAHTLILESGGFDRWQRKRLEIVGFTPDQGAESQVVNAAERVANATGLTHWREATNTVVRGIST